MKVDTMQLDLPATLAAARQLTYSCHVAAYQAGWWNDLKTGEDQTFDYKVDVLQGGMKPGRSQVSTHKSYEGRARAVRLIPLAQGTTP